MKIIGITGGIGSGKSTIASELQRRGYEVYDCDQEAKHIIEEDPMVRRAIIALLGKESFNNTGYNTTYVSKRVFGEPQLLLQLNEIVHPAVIRKVQQLKNTGQENDKMFVESAILYTSGLDALCDYIVVVEAAEEMRIARTINRDYNGEATPENINKVRARIRTQRDYEEGVRNVPFVVQNDGKKSISSIVDEICSFLH